MKNKIKSYGFWTALSGAVVVLLNAIGECFGFSVDNEMVSGLIMAVAGILVVFGVVSMPEDNKNSTEDDNIDGKEKTEIDSEKPAENQESTQQIEQQPEEKIQTATEDQNQNK